MIWFLGTELIGAVMSVYQGLHSSANCFLRCFQGRMIISLQAVLMNFTLKVGDALCRWESLTRKEGTMTPLLDEKAEVVFSSLGVLSWCLKGGTTVWVYCSLNDTLSRLMYTDFWNGKPLHWIVFGCICFSRGRGQGWHGNSLITRCSDFLAELLSLLRSNSLSLLWSFVFYLGISFSGARKLSLAQRFTTHDL